MENADRDSFGEFVPTINSLKAFVPANLPPQIEWDSGLVAALSYADRAIGQLHGVGLNLPNPDLLITPFIRREAEMSSRIEGTQAQVADIYLFEMKDRTVESKVPDVREVSNYVRALNYGLERKSKLPVCLRLIRDLHKILLEGVRGEDRAAGEFRKVQNWIGPKGCPIEQASYIPPPPEKLPSVLDAFEKFVNSPTGKIPVLVWLAMVHYQFEAIHPFLNGNGRIGRLLITLLLCSKAILDKPLLYLSAYFERNRDEYYQRLLQVSLRRRWAEWLLFFLRGVTEQSIDAFEKARQLMDLRDEYHEIIRNTKRSALQIRMVDLLIEYPVLTTVFVRDHFNITYPAAQSNIDKLVKAGILKAVSAAKRHKLFIAEKVLEIINKPFVEQDSR
jgi:Fic family protein